MIRSLERSGRTMNRAGSVFGVSIPPNATLRFEIEPVSIAGK